MSNWQPNICAKTLAFTLEPLESAKVTFINLTFWHNWNRSPLYDHTVLYDHCFIFKTFFRSCFLEIQHIWGARSRLSLSDHCIRWRNWQPITQSSFAAIRSHVETPSIAPTIKSYKSFRKLFRPWSVSIVSKVQVYKGDFRRFQGFRSESQCFGTYVCWPVGHSDRRYIFIYGRLDSLHWKLDDKADDLLQL